MMDKVPNGFNMMAQFFVEQVVEAFNIIGFTTFLANCLMPLAEKHLLINLPKVGVADHAMPI